MIFLFGDYYQREKLVFQRFSKTSHGEAKIIDMVDASGAGDVKTSTIVEAKDGEIEGITGRKLKIPDSWHNPGGKYHIGVKNGYELYPKVLKERIQSGWKENEWDPNHKLVQAEAIRCLQEFDNKHPDSSQLTAEERLEREELDARVEVLTTLEKKYKNDGPVYDCVVFHDGNMWRAAIDTSEVGDLESCALLGTYRETLQYATLTQKDMLNYAVNIYDEGNLLEIVTTSSSHGTHVASISAAYFPDQPDKNGIAPGAQLVSICIGDNRLGTMETGAALVRAMAKVIQLKCDIINMSYGEHGHWSGGRVMDMVHEVVNKYGVIMVSSAGNNGPCLSTVGTPPTMQSLSVIGVGAYVSPDMAAAEYSLCEKVLGMGYTWTSRGPTLTGDLGVCISAPGGAITSVPNWTLRGAQLMNGTSMSSPHVSGAMGVLLSACKTRSIPYSPYSIRRAIENTALKVDSWDAFSMGHGLLQVEKAFDHIVDNAGNIERDIRFHIECNNKYGGIYLRNSHDFRTPKVIQITVEPFFLDDQNADPHQKISFQMNLRIVCDCTWLMAPTHLSMAYTARSFSVKVDARGLSPGAHFTLVRAYDVQNPQKGPVFSVPVTVIKPKNISENTDWELAVSGVMMKPGAIVREFIEIPRGATWAVIKIKSHNQERSSTFILHSIQLQPQMSCTGQEFFKRVQLGPQGEVTLACPVKDNITSELCIARWWTNSHDIVIDYSIAFHGLKPNQPNITMIGADGIHRVEIASLLKQEEALPVVCLKHHVQVLRPTENKLVPLGCRDIIPKGRQIYGLQLNYTFTIMKQCEVTPSCPLLCDLLYESEYEGQLWMLFDCNKQLIYTGDAYPSKYSVKLEKGDYTVKLQVRHEQRSLLEKITDMPLLVQSKLPSSLSLDIYADHSEALIGGKKFCTAILKPGATCPVFITPLPSEKLSKCWTAGQYLTGTITYAKDDLGKKSDIYSFKYIIPEIPKKPSLNKTHTEKEKTPEEMFTEALRDLKISWISKLKGKYSDDLYEEMISKDPGHVPLLQARLQYLDGNKAERQNNLQEIIKVGDTILSHIDITELLAALGAKKDPLGNNNNNYKISPKVGGGCYQPVTFPVVSSLKLGVVAVSLISFHKEETIIILLWLKWSPEKQKLVIIDTLVKKGMALCDLKYDTNGQCESKGAGLDTEKTSSKSLSTQGIVNSTQQSDGSGESENVGKSLVVCSTSSVVKDINKIYSELQKFVDVSDSKAAPFTEKHALFHNHYGRAIKLLLKLQEEKALQTVEKRLIELFQNLGWNHCSQLYERSFFVRYPPDYRLF
ncbi:tripeptidyl-peptidase II isoform X2 [Tachypleus tridentatus]|uniref:tripeptidyl-peptidase II isoform X2 n=1 Tax=Tachypleus tridentatus TaxID=6853 RepID=UPI003FD14C98